MAFLSGLNSPYRSRLSIRCPAKDGEAIMEDPHIRLKQLEILTALAQGVHPLTGEVLPADCPYHSAEIVRALYGAVRSLESARPTEARDGAAIRPREGALANAGKPWSVDEDRQLLVEFDAGKTVKECATAHQRTQAGIEARLEKLGRLKSEDRTTPRRYPVSGRNGDARTNSDSGTSA